MAQLKQVCTVANGSQTVTIIGVNVAYRIRANNIFMVASELVPYVIAADAVYDGTNTVVTLAANYQGASAPMTNCVFATDFTVPDNLPLISQGDVGTAAIWTKAMYQIQDMITEINPAGFAASIAEIHASLNGANAAMQAAAGSQTAAHVSEQNAATSEANAKASEQNAKTSETNAKTSETNSAASQAAAAASAAAALASQNAAHTSETNSATSAAASAASATRSDTRATDSNTAANAAAASAAQIQAALHSLNAVWLGEKTADPTVDNNGDPLVDGARYFNTAMNPKRTRVYNAGVWGDENLDAEQATANAQLSASAAAGSASAASGSQSAAATSEANAKASETNSAASAAAALASKTAAATSEANAATSATNAFNSAAAVNGYLELDVGAADVTLTATQAANGIMKFTGQLAGNRTVTLPATSHPFIVENGTTNPQGVSYTLTIAAQGKAPAAQVLQGKASSLFCDTTGVYATSATTGVQFAGETPVAVDTVLDLSHLGRLIVQTIAGRVTTLPKANTYPKGAGVGIKALAAASIAIQAGDTAELVMPFGTAVHDFFFWESDGVSNWRLAWWNNAFTPAFQTSVAAPKLLANTTDNGTDAIQAGGSISSKGSDGMVRLSGADSGMPSKLAAIAHGLALESADASAITFKQNNAESGRFSPAGRLLIGTTTDDGASPVQVNGVIRSITGGFKFPDGTVQTTANGVTAPVSTVVTPTAGAVLIPTNGYSAPFVQVFKNNGKLIFGVDFSLPDGMNVSLTTPATGRDRYEVLTSLVYSPSTVFQPTSATFSLALNATTITTPYTVGCYWVFKNNMKLIPTRDYTGTDGAVITLVNASDNVNDVYEVVTFTPFAINGMLPLSGGTLTGDLKRSGNAGTKRSILLQTAGANRWEVGASSTAEAGSNAGSDLSVSRYDDTGAYIDTPLTLSRQTGALTLGQTPSVPGLSFPVASARITGDFTNATYAQRVLFQTSAANSFTSVGAIPSGTGNGAYFTCWSKSDPTNAAFLQMAVVEATIASISSGAAGTGTNVPLAFNVNGAERLRLDTGGSILIGSSSYVAGYATGTALQNGGKWFVGNGASVFQQNNDANIYLSKAAGYTTGSLMVFYAAGTSAGSITTSGTSISFNTSSDYRLKENVISMTGALDRLMQAKPSRFNFKTDTSKTQVDGFLAHEIAEVVPEAVTGEKDAVTYSPVLRDGADPTNVKPEDVIEVEETIVPQALDHSKLVPLLVGAVQELKHQLDAALAEIAQLKKAA
jgi:hypothetical protein